MITNTVQRRAGKLEEIQIALKRVIELPKLMSGDTILAQVTQDGEIIFAQRAFGLSELALIQSWLAEML